MGGRRESDEEEEEPKERNRTGGVAIAPPPSLQTNSTPPPLANEPKPSEVILPSATPPNISFVGSAVAAKIMARYGFKEGQGLGKKEQGMSLALQVIKDTE